MLLNLIIILNVFILESILSIDNAAVLAIMVKSLPGKDKSRALKYGILGAYLLRGLCLLFAYYLIKIIWLKIIGGLYLLYLVYGEITKGESDEEKETPVHQFFGLNIFWSTVIMVEIMDLAFSIDNIFAVIAMSNNIFYIMIGVAIGIIAMRFVASQFSVLINKYPALESAAYVVITLLGLKLIISGIAAYIPILNELQHAMDSISFDILFTSITFMIFFYAIIIKPKKI